MKSLLIVDDSFTVRKVIEMLLAPLGYNLSFAENFAKAIENIKSKSFDAVVLDHGLPDKDGVSACREIKSKHPGLPVLLMFNGKEELPEKAVKESLCDDIVEKPFDSQSFLSKIEGLKDKSSMIAMEPIKEEPPLKAEAVTKEEPFFDFDLGEEFAVEPQKGDEMIMAKPAVEPAGKEKAPVAGEIEEIEEIEELEELEELAEVKKAVGAGKDTPGLREIKASGPASDELGELVEEISLEELLDDGAFKEEPEDTSEPEISFEGLDENEREEPKFAGTPKVDIEDFFSDLNDILAEKGSKPQVTERAWDSVKVTPVVEEVAKGLREFEAVGKRDVEKKMEEKGKIAAGEDDELDVWAFETDTEKTVKTKDEIAHAADFKLDSVNSLDRKELENMIKEITYDVIEKIAWEVVPEIVETILKDKQGRK